MVLANGSTEQIVRNALLGYVAAFIGATTGFIVTPLLLHRLGVHQFGVWTLMLSVIGYTGLLEIGLGTAAAKRIAEYWAQNDQKRVEKVVSTTLLLYAFLGLLALVVTLCLASQLHQWFHLSGKDLVVARGCLLVLGINQFLFFLFNVQSTILFGSGRMDLMTVFDVILFSASACVQVLLVLSGCGIVSLAWATIVATLIRGCISRWVIRTNLFDVKIGIQTASRTTAKDLLTFGSRNAVIALCGTVAFGSDLVIIGLLYPVANVAYYVIAAKLITLATALATKPIEVLMPAYSHSHALGDATREFDLFTESITIAQGIAGPMIVVLCTFGSAILNIWVGKEHLASYPILIVLALALFFRLPGYSSFTILMGTGYNGVLMRYALIAGPVNLILSVLFARAFGPIGVALGSLVTVSIADFVVLPYLVCRQLGFDYRTYITRILTPITLPTIASVTLALLLKAFRWDMGVIRTLVSVLCIAGIYIALWLGLGLGKERRERYVRRMMSCTRRAA